MSNLSRNPNNTNPAENQLTTEQTNADVSVDLSATEPSVLADMSAPQTPVPNVADTVANGTTHAGEAVIDAVQHTTQTIEAGTNQALEFLGVPIDIDALIALSVEWTGKIVLALLVFFVGKWIGKRILRVAELAMSRSRMDATAANFLSNVLYGLMLVAVTLAALNKLGINTNSFVAILGAAAVAIGMALKDQLGNLAAGVMIVMFRPFNRGDNVEIAGQTGRVIDINLVNTRIKTPNNHEVIIPNGDIMTSASTNFSSLPQRRVEVPVGIGYECDIQTARELILKEVHQYEPALQVPEPIVRVVGLGDNSVDLMLYVWAQNDDWWAVHCDLLERIKYSFDKHGISIPYPQRSLHLEGVDLKALNQALMANNMYPKE